MTGWVKGPGGVLRYDGQFPEPTDAELVPYGFKAGARGRNDACGTTRGRARHVRDGEPVCGACRAAFAAYYREYRERRAQRQILGTTE